MLSRRQALAALFSAAAVPVVVPVARKIFLPPRGGWLVQPALSEASLEAVMLELHELYSRQLAASMVATRERYIGVALNDYRRVTYGTATFYDADGSVLMEIVK